MKNKGFTLVEILVALALAGLVMTAVYSTYMMQHKAYVVQDQVAAIQQNLRAAMYLMELDLRMAGYDPEETTNSGLTVAQPGMIQFTYVADDDGNDNDDDGTVDEANEENTVTYGLYDADGDGVNDLGRVVPLVDSDVVNLLDDGDPDQLIAENIDALDFVYYDGTGTDAADEIDVGAGDDINDIRVIEVTMVARAYREDLDYTNNQSYTNSLGEVILAGGGDHFRRRTLTKQIRGRNLGL